MIELLVVIAILMVLVSLAIIGFKNIATSRGVTQAAADVAGLLELSRNEAVTRQSYVWVAIQEATNSGSIEVQMIAAYSADGSTAGGTNLIPLSRLLTVRGVGLANFSSLKQETRDLFTNSSAINELTTNSAGIVFTNLPAARFTGKSTITFTPRGEAMLRGAPTSTDGFDPAIGIGLVPARGTVKASGGDDAGVILEGSTGVARVIRL